MKHGSEILRPSSDPVNLQNCIWIIKKYLLYKRSAVDSLIAVTQCVITLARLLFKMNDGPVNCHILSRTSKTTQYRHEYG